MMLSNWLAMTIVVAGICVALTVGAFAEEKFQKLNGQQIRAKFVGMESSRMNLIGGTSLNRMGP
jgi:hypothetical protein